MNIVMRHLKFWPLIITLMAPGLSFSQDEGPSKSDPIVATGVIKDKASKTLTMNLEHGDNSITADFQLDRREITSMSFLRFYLLDQQKEAQKQVVYIRKYMTDPKFYKQLRLGSTEQDRLELVDRLKTDEQVIETFHKLVPRQKDLIYLAYRADTFDHNARKNFYANYLGLPKTISQADLLKHFEKLPKQMQDEIARLYHVSHDGMGHRLRHTFARPWNTALHGFPAQSILFSVAIGAVMMTKLYTDYAANPAALLQHLESLDDPIAHLAFYSFMAANGFTADILSSRLGGLGGGRTRKAFRAAIPYIGMTAGMLASNLTHEVALLVGSCSDRLLGKKDAKKEAEMQMMRLMNPKFKEPCDAALDEFFNFENKVEQYIPMIISMSLSTAGSTVAQGLFVKAGNGIKNAAQNFSNQYDAALKAEAGKPAQTLKTISGQSPHRYYSNVAADKLIKVTKTAARGSIRITGLVLAARVTPAGFIFNSITVGAAVYSLAQNFAFVYLDTIMIPSISRWWAQIWRAGSVAKADKALRAAIIHHQRNNWTEISKGCRTVTPTLSPEELMMSSSSAESYEVCDHEIIEILENFQKQMEAWRMQNHARFFTGVQIWTDITQKLIKEIDEAEKFYLYYVDQVFTNRRLYLKKNLEGKLQGQDTMNYNLLPYRSTPLFGVMPLGHRECEMDQAAALNMLAGSAESNTEKQDPNCETDMALYKNHPDRMIGFQRNRLQAVVNHFGQIVGMGERALPYYEAPAITGIDVFDQEAQAAAKAESNNNTTTENKTVPLSPEDRAHIDKIQKKFSSELAQALKNGQRIKAQEMATRLFRQDGMYEPKTLKENLKPASKEFISKLFNDFQSTNYKTIGDGLLRLNHEIKTNRLRDPVAQVLLVFIRSTIGNPSPIMTLGTAVPYLYHEDNKDNPGYKEQSKSAYGYRFSRHVEYLIYQMICGPEANSNKVITEWGTKNTAFLPPKFHPPKLVSKNDVQVRWRGLENVMPEGRNHTGGPSITSLCMPVVGTPVPFTALYNSEIVINGVEKPMSFFEYLNAYISPRALGKLSPQNPKDPKQLAEIASDTNKSSINSWWDASVRSPLRALFVKLDDRYQDLLTDLVLGLQSDETLFEETNFWGNKTGILKVRKPWKRTEASRSLLDSNIEEINVYMKILAAIENNHIAVKHNGGKPLPNFANINKNAKVATNISLVAEMKHDPKALVKSQNDVISSITNLIKLLRNVSVIEVNGKNRVQVKGTPGNMTGHQKQALEALKAYREHLNKLGIVNKYQIQVAKTAFDGLEKSVQNLGVYLVNIQLANYDMMTKFDEYLNAHAPGGQNNAPVNNSYNPFKR